MSQHTLVQFRDSPAPKPKPRPLTAPKPKPRTGTPTAPPVTTHIMREASSDAFDEILNDGTLGAMLMKALGLVTDTPDKTVRELLKIGVDDEIYPYADRNMIAPRITGLAKEGIIIRPYKRNCTVTGKLVAVHRLAPKDWKHHRDGLRKQFSKGKLVLGRLEIKSKTKENRYHTVIHWSDGSISCSCDKTYHRPSDRRCHHAKGMFKAITGKDMKGAK